MSRGIAVCLGPAPAKYFQEGSQLFRLYPSLGEHEHLGNTVAVAFSMAAVDHGQRETTVFQTNEAGMPDYLSRGGDRYEVLERCHRIVGKHDIPAALGNLCYIPVEDHQVPVLREKGMALAKDYALRSQLLDPDDYAANNWGMFAARYLVVVGGVEASQPVANDVDWAYLDRRAAQQRRDELELDHGFL